MRKVLYVLKQLYAILWIYNHNNTKSSYHLCHSKGKKRNLIPYFTDNIKIIYEILLTCI